MSKSVISDAGAGRALFVTRMKLTVHAFNFALWSGALPGLLLPPVIWIGYLNATDVDLLKQNIVSHVLPDSTPRTWAVRDADGAPAVVTVTRSDGTDVQLLTPGQFRDVTRNYSPVLRWFPRVELFAIGSAVLGYISVWRTLTKVGRKARKNKLIRGKSDVVAPRELSTEVRKRGAGPYQLLGMSLPLKAPMQGILFQGAPGTGKSLGQHDLMLQVFARGKKCVIYDHSGEYYKAYFRPGKDILFNPAMLGCIDWSIFAELVNTYDSNTLSHAFLPPKAGVVHGASAFFEDAARALFSVMLRRLAERGATYTRLIAEGILSMPEDELDLLIRDSVASSAVGGDSKGQRQGVISSIAIYLDGIAAVPDGEWSMRKFFDADDDARFFIVNTDDTKAMFSPIYRLLLTVAFGAIAAKAEIVHEDRYWFFLDEAAQLGDIRLDEWQATLRKYGVCVVTGTQADNQYFSTMGKERGQTLLNCFNTMVMLRTPEPDMAERMARRLTKRDMEVVAEGQAVAVSEWRDGGNIGGNEGEKFLVAPVQIQELDDCVAYVALPGTYPVAKVDYRHWLPKWYRPWPHIRRFRERHDFPPRDPRFRISRAVGQDALASVREDAERERAEREARELAKQKLEADGEWVLVDEETGEVSRASAPGTTGPDASAASTDTMTGAEGLFTGSIRARDDEEKRT